MSRARILANYVSSGVTAAEFDFLDVTSGTADATTFLRGDKTWQIVDTEGTGIKSTGESGGDKFLREDGDGTSSWQSAGSPFPVGSESAPSIHFAGDTDTGMFRPLANELDLVTAGNTGLHIGPTGNIGIGTEGPDQLLTLKKNSATTGGIPFIRLENFENNTGAAIGAHIEFFLDNSNSNHTGASIGCIEDGIDGYGELVFKTTAASNSSTLIERMRVTSNGGVGVGTGIPTANFEVWGTTNSTLVVNRGGASSGETAVFFKNDNGTPGGNNISGAVVCDASNDLQFRTGGNTTRVTIAANGNATFTGDITCENLSTADLIMSNQNPNRDGNEIDGTKGSWVMQEGKENMYLINRNNGKRFKIMLEEV